MTVTWEDLGWERVAAGVSYREMLAEFGPTAIVESTLAARDKLTPADIAEIEKLLKELKG